MLRAWHGGSPLCGLLSCMRPPREPLTRQSPLRQGPPASSRTRRAVCGRFWAVCTQPRAPTLPICLPVMITVAARRRCRSEPKQDHLMTAHAAASTRPTGSPLSPGYTIRCPPRPPAAQRAPGRKVTRPSHDTITRPEAPLVPVRALFRVTPPRGPYYARDTIRARVPAKHLARPQGANPARPSLRRWRACPGRGGLCRRTAGVPPRRRCRASPLSWTRNAPLRGRHGRRRRARAGGGEPGERVGYGSQRPGVPHVAGCGL